MIELKPLPTFNATYPHDINDPGQVVGKSHKYQGAFGPAPSADGPHSTATLWEGGTPSALTTSPNRSEALKINNKGEILYVQYDHPLSDTNPTYFLWKNGTAVDLKTLVPGLISAVDLNDSSLIVGLRDSGVFLYDLGTRSLAPLPPLVVNGSASALRPSGIDNLGRIAAISNNFPQGQTSQDVYWLPPGGTSWNNSEIERIEKFIPQLSKSGRLLALVADGQAGVGCYLDLNSPGRGPIYLPRAPDPADPVFQVVVPLDADSQGRIVGMEISSSNTFLYDASSGKFSKPKLDPGWVGHSAIGINEQGVVIGYGTKNFGSPAYLERGWIVEWKRPPVPVPLAAWMVLLGAVIQDGGGFGITYGGIPVPIDPWGPLLPPEKMDILTTLALAEFGAMLNDPELRQIVKRAEIELLEKATKLAIDKGR